MKEARQSGNMPITRWAAMLKALNTMRTTPTPVSLMSTDSCQRQSKLTVQVRAFAMNNNMAYAPKDMVSSDRPRLRATSATFPLHLDLEDQYRSQSTHARASDHHGVSLSDPSTQYTNPNIYTTSYPPAPLTAPLSSTYSRANDAKSHLAGPPPRAGTASSSRATEYLLGPHNRPGNAEPHQDPRAPLSHQTHAGRPHVFHGENRSSEYTSRP